MLGSVSPDFALEFGIPFRTHRKSGPLSQLNYALFGSKSIVAMSMAYMRLGGTRSIGTGSRTETFPVRAANRAILPVLWRTPESAFFFGKLIEHERRFFGDPGHFDY
jgi:hypothetical protein